MALALLHLLDAEAAIPLVVGGLFVNHLLAKAGLFWLAGYVGKENIEDWSVLARQTRDIRICPPALRDRRFAAIPGVLGQVAVDLRACVAAAGYVWIALVLAGVAARSCLSLSVVRPEPPSAAADGSASEARSS